MTLAAVTYTLIALIVLFFFYIFTGKLQTLCNCLKSFLYGLKIIPAWFHIQEPERYRYIGLYIYVQLQMFSQNVIAWMTLNHSNTTQTCVCVLSIGNTETSAIYHRAGKLVYISLGDLTFKERRGSSNNLVRLFNQW